MKKNRSYTGHTKVVKIKQFCKRAQNNYLPKFGFFAAAIIYYIYILLGIFQNMRIPFWVHLFKRYAEFLPQARGPQDRPSPNNRLCMDLATDRRNKDSKHVIFHETRSVRSHKVPHQSWKNQLIPYGSSQLEFNSREK